MALSRMEDASTARTRRSAEEHRADLACDPPVAGGPCCRVPHHRAEQAHAERLRRKPEWPLRDECLNEHMVRNLPSARRLIEEWRTDYKTHRPHTSLGGLTSNEFATWS